MAKKKSGAAPASAKKLVVVESPTKAKTIRKFLGKDYIVESCMGHVRDLPQSAKDIPEEAKKKPWAQLGVDVDHGFEPLYLVPKNKTKVVRALKDKLKEADELILATDEDREGESISWHLVETLKPKVPYRRMVFNEITKDAIVEALGNVRDIDYNLVRAQEARRVLDRLVGYTISPLLWKKVAYGLSAGRVQSVAVRLICEREDERIRFKRAIYWSIEAACEKDAIGFDARLLAVGGKRIATGKDFDAETGQLSADRKDVLQLDGRAAEALRARLAGQPWKTTEVEEKPISRKPPAPFITSTLQQESNRKLGLSARETMQVAQSLYEQGFITYMRTDSTFLSQQALGAARKKISELYGPDYLPPEPRTYDAKKAKGAQEAHEAIRPAGTEFLTPEETGLSGAQKRVYELIWMRTMASQMPNSRQKQVSVRFQAADAVFGASGMTIEFPGFLRAYVEGHDDEAGALEEREARLPALKAGDAVRCRDLKALEHETKPPARYTEASLVQTMEREGIGRPSTYAAVIGTIIDRGYVRKAGNALAPTFTAMVVAKLLSRHLPQYVDLGFTSEMEKSLDTIADGELDWANYLKSVYFGEKGLKKQVETQEKKIDPSEARAIALPGLEALSFRVGRFGAYVCRPDKDGGEACASLPEAQAPADITADIANKLIDQKLNGSDALGKDPKTGLPVYVLTGRYGPYVQLGDASGDAAKPKRVSVPAGVLPETVDLQQALQLLELPKTLGAHPGTGKEVKAGLGRFGPYVVCDGDFRSIPKGESLFEIGLPRALELLSQPKRGRGRAAPLKEFGLRPGSEEPVVLLNGKYGPYVKWGKVNASLPEGMKPEAVTMEIALKLIDDRRGGALDDGDGAGKKQAKKAVAKAAPPKRLAGKSVVSGAKRPAARKATTGKAPLKTAPLKTARKPAPKPVANVGAKGPAGAGKTAPKGRSPAKGAAGAGSPLKKKSK